MLLHHKIDIAGICFAEPFPAFRAEYTYLPILPIYPLIFIWGGSVRTVIYCFNFMFVLLCFLYLVSPFTRTTLQSYVLYVRHMKHTEIESTCIQIAYDLKLFSYHRNGVDNNSTDIKQNNFLSPLHWTKNPLHMVMEI